MEYVTLNNGIKMPKLGYGVYQTRAEDTKRCVLDAIDVSNSGPDRYLDIGHFAGVKPAVNQIGSWGPFAEGSKECLRIPC